MTPRSAKPRLGLAMTNAKKLEALKTIIRDGAMLRNLAKDSGNDFLASLLESVLREARAMLTGGGHEPLGPASASGEQSGSSVVPWPRKPRKTPPQSEKGN